MEAQKGPRPSAGLGTPPTGCPGGGDWRSLLRLQIMDGRTDGQMNRVETHCVCEALGLQLLVLEGLLQSQDLRLVLLHRQLHRLARLGASLLRTKPAGEDRGTSSIIIHFCGEASAPVQEKNSSALVGWFEGHHLICDLAASISASPTPAQKRSLDFPEYLGRNSGEFAKSAACVWAEASWLRYFEQEKTDGASRAARPVLLLRVQQPLDLPGPPLRLVLLILQRGPPGFPLSLLLQQLVVHGLQLHHLLL